MVLAIAVKESVRVSENDERRDENGGIFYRKNASIRKESLSGPWRKRRDEYEKLD